jgi:ATP-dependent RNA helicase RhlE
LPNIPEDYVHRIGRTGRAEQAEKLFRYSVRRNGFLRDIEKLVGLNLPKENIRGFEPDPNASKEPIKQGQGRQQRDSTPRKPKQTLQTEAVTTVLVQDVRVKIMTDVLIDN